MATLIKQAFIPTLDSSSRRQDVELVMTKLQAKLYASLLVSAFVLSAGVSA